MRRAICIFSVFCLSSVFGLVYDNEMKEVYKTLVDEPVKAGFVRVKNYGEELETFQFNKRDVSGVNVKMFVNGVEADFGDNFRLGPGEIEVIEFQAQSGQPNAVTSRVEVERHTISGSTLDKVFFIKTVVSGKGDYAVLHPGFERNNLIVKGTSSVAGEAIINVKNLGNAEEVFSMDVKGDVSDFQILDGSIDVTSESISFMPNEEKELKVRCSGTTPGQSEVTVEAMGMSDSNGHHLGRFTCVVEDDAHMRPFHSKYDSGEMVIVDSIKGKNYKIENALNEDNAVVTYVINMSAVQKTVEIRSSGAVEVYYKGLSQEVVSVALTPGMMESVEVKCLDDDEIYGTVIYADESGVIDTHTVECVFQQSGDMVRFDGAEYHHIETTVGSKTQDEYRLRMTNLGESKAHLDFDFDTDLFILTNDERVIHTSETIDVLGSMTVRVNCNNDVAQQLSGDIVVSTNSQEFVFKVSCDVNDVLQRSVVVTGLEDEIDIMENNEYFRVNNNGQATQWIRFVSTNYNVKVSFDVTSWVNEDLIPIHIGESHLFDISCGKNEESENNYVSMLVLKNRVFHTEKTVKVSCKTKSREVKQETKVKQVKQNRKSFRGDVNV